MKGRRVAWFGLARVLFLAGLLPLLAHAQLSPTDRDGDGLTDAQEARLGTDPTQIDTDGDYLADGEEVALGTDPTQADSDEDGLPDYSEVRVHGTDPLDKDTDGGGTIDGQEVLIDRTDPTSAEDDLLDSDGDGLPNRIELRLGTDPFSADSDGDLLTDGIEDHNHDGVRGGDRGQPGVFEPAFGDETDPTAPDSDGDGVPDGIELLALGSDPFAEDTDGDGLSDGTEAELRETDYGCLELTLADSDGDGLSDGEELGAAVASSPCLPDTDGDGIYDSVEVWDETDPSDPSSKRVDTDLDHLSDAYESAVSHTDPQLADTDGDGLPDAEETLLLADMRQTDPLDADMDDDGILDGHETPIVNGRVQFLTDPQLTDTDGDGLYDGMEIGLSAPESSDRDPDATRPEVFQADADPSSTTNPLLPDTDGDGLLDGAEDLNHNGLREADETSPNAWDSDGDGLDDGWETRYADLSECDLAVVATVDPLNPSDGPLDYDGDGLTNLEEYGWRPQGGIGPFSPISTNPCAEDTDHDGLKDPIELGSSYGNGRSNPTQFDTDGDGLSDGLEDKDHDGVWNQSRETDPTRRDTDADGIFDDAEDANQDGEVSPGETDPKRADSDGDGIDDGREWALFGTDPTSPDTDGDELSDGLELGLLNDADPSTSTDPRNSDTDGDGIEDGIEDANKNGAIDEGETHPRLADTDGDRLKDGEEDSDQDGIFEPQRGESDPRRSDTDRGGVDDGTEVREDGTDPNDPLDDREADPDMDGLSTRIELQLGTQPLSADSDGDFVSDGEEVGSDWAKPVDFDGDGTIDALDGDSDDDGVPDAVEAGDRDLATPRPDSDGDGLNDLNDVDSDNGGVADGTELNVHHTDRLNPKDDGRGWFEDGASVRGSGCSLGSGTERSGWPLEGLGMSAILLWLLVRGRGRTRKRRTGARLCGFLCLLSTSAASAQQHPDARTVTVDGSPYRMNPSGETLANTSLPLVLRHLQWQARAAIHHFADSILVKGADGKRLRSILEDRQQVEIAAALGLYDWAELSVH